MVMMLKMRYKRNKTDCTSNSNNSINYIPFLALIHCSVMHIFSLKRYQSKQTNKAARDQSTTRFWHHFYSPFCLMNDETYNFCTKLSANQRPIRDFFKNCHPRWFFPSPDFLILLCSSLSGAISSQCDASISDRWLHSRHTLERPPLSALPKSLGL